MTRPGSGSGPDDGRPSTGPAVERSRGRHAAPDEGAGRVVPPAAPGSGGRRRAPEEPRTDARSPSDAEPPGSGSGRRRAGDGGSGRRRAAEDGAPESGRRAAEDRAPESGRRRAADGGSGRRRAVEDEVTGSGRRRAPEGGGAGSGRRRAVEDDGPGSGRRRAEEPPARRHAAAEETPRGFPYVRPATDAPVDRRDARSLPVNGHKPAATDGPRSNGHRADPPATDRPAGLNGHRPLDGHPPAAGLDGHRPLDGHPPAAGLNGHGTGAGPNGHRPGDAPDGHGVVEPVNGLRVHRPPPVVGRPPDALDGYPVVPLNGFPFTRPADADDRPVNGHSGGRHASPEAPRDRLDWPVNGHVNGHGLDRAERDAAAWPVNGHAAPPIAEPPATDDRPAPLQGWQREPFRPAYPPVLPRDTPEPDAAPGRAPSSYAPNSPYVRPAHLPLPPVAEPPSPYIRPTTTPHDPAPPSPHHLPPPADARPRRETTPSDVTPAEASPYGLVAPTETRPRRDGTASPYRSPEEALPGQAAPTEARGSGSSTSAPAEGATAVEAPARRKAKPDHPPRAVVRRRRARRRAAEWPFLIVFALISAYLIRAYVVQTFYIPSGSMHETLLEGDRVLVNKVSYHLHDVHRGDVVVFRRPPDFPVEDDDLIKRVVGLPGETVEGHDGKVYVGGAPLDEPYVEPACNGTRDFEKITVPADRLWVMGDNRCNSSDSRVFGTIDDDLLVGRAFVLAWPLGRLSWL